MGKSASEQKRIKLGRVAAAFEALSMELPEVACVAGSDRDYRNRLRLRIDDGQVAFFNPEKALDCVVLEPRLRDAIARLRAAAAESPRLMQGLQWVEVRGEDAHGQVSACFAPQVDRTESDVSAADAQPAGTESLEATRTALQTRLGPRFLVGFLGEADPPWQRYSSEGTELAVALGGFLQVNHEINRALVRFVLEQAQGCSEFVDLYAGCGNFALPLAARGLTGVAVESSRVSAHSMSLGAKAAGFGKLRVVHADVGAMVTELSATPSAFVIADPPRAGLGDVAGELSRLCSRTLLLVSCNPQTLARDIARLGSRFRLESMRAFDMFPHTEHIELAAVLRHRA